MDFKKQKTIYQQIADRICDQILATRWGADERIPSVREIAADLGVNPNTAMRSFDYLQGADIIYNKRGVGYFVAVDANEKILTLRRKEFYEEELPEFLNRLASLGLTLKDLQENLDK